MKNFKEKILGYAKEKFSSINIDQSDSVLEYSSLKEEYEALIRGVGIRDISKKGVFKLTGKDVSDFLHRISTNEINSLKHNESINTLFTNEKGRIIDRTVLLKLESFFILISSGVYSDKINRWISKYIITEDINCESAHDDYCLFEFLGPQAESYLTLICGNCIDEIDDRKILRIALDNLNVIVFKHSADKYWMLAESKYYSEVLDCLMSYPSVFEPKFVGESAYEIYRIEKGIPKAPFELNDNYNPHEALLINEVCSTKGCYIGQEVIARLETYDKVQKELVKIEINGEMNINGQQHDISDDDNNNLGTVTSIVNSKISNKIIGLAYIRKDALERDEKMFALSNNDRYEIKIK